ncbi:hypothetical protein LINPERPRIM_LOCUS16538 [Linum perenne]
MWRPKRTQVQLRLKGSLLILRVTPATEGLKIRPTSGDCSVMRKVQKTFMMRHQFMIPTVTTTICSLCWG